MKRPLRWIEAARIILDQEGSAHFVIFGSGEMLEEAKAKAKGFGMADKIKFFDWEPDIFKAMSCMDIFMLSSASEGFGNVLVEAQACGVPPIAYDVGGCRETMIPDVTGRVVGEDTAEALAKAALHVLEDLRWRKTAARLGRDFVRSKFCIERMVRQMRDLMTAS
jgi:glycosyltransferase involved in cell wall biosynthesis